MNKRYLFFLIITIFSCNNYTKENYTINPEDVIYLWYCSFKSIEEKNNKPSLYESMDDKGRVTFNNITFKDEKHKDFRLNLYRTMMGLDDSWKFEMQDFGYNNVGNFHYLIKIDIYFSKGDETIFTESLFYYNHLGNKDEYLGYFEPIQIESKTFLIKEDEIHVRKHKEIWNGDFEIKTK